MQLVPAYLPLKPWVRQNLGFRLSGRPFYIRPLSDLRQQSAGPFLPMVDIIHKFIFHWLSGAARFKKIIILLVVSGRSWSRHRWCSAIKQRPPGAFPAIHYWMATSLRISLRIHSQVSVLRYVLTWKPGGPSQPGRLLVSAGYASGVISHHRSLFMASAPPHLFAISGPWWLGLDCCRLRLRRGLSPPSCVPA